VKGRAAADGLLTMKWSERMARGFSPGFGDTESALKGAAEVGVDFPTIAITPNSLDSFYH
jgi:hypothetical protein